MVPFRGVTDIGTGLQAVAAAITDPDTISAFQSESRDGNMSHRTFYGGMHELSDGLDDAASGIHELAKVLPCPLATHVDMCGAVDSSYGRLSDGASEGDLHWMFRLYTMWETLLRA